jgi:hypothetical protein
MMAWVRTRWPWVSLAALGAIALSPVGRDFLWAAFASSEQLSRDIARPIVLAATGASIAAASCEYLLRRWLAGRR